MFREAILVDGYYRRRVQRKIVVFMESDALRRTVDIDAFEVAMRLDDALAGMVVGVTARLAVVRKHHQAIFFVPIELSCLLG